MEFDDPAHLITSLRMRADEGSHGLMRRSQQAIVLAGVTMDEKPVAYLHGYLRIGLYSGNGEFDLDQIRVHLHWFGRAVQVDAVFAVIVDGDGPDRPHSRPDYALVLAEIRANARRCGSELAHAWHVPSLDPGTSWTSLTAPTSSGVVTGPPTPGPDTHAVSGDERPECGARCVNGGCERERLDAVDFLVERIRGLGSDALSGRVSPSPFSGARSLLSGLRAQPAACDIGDL
ncbi:DUF4192 family protein [Nocardia cyriacigeorgica]|uniref:DUF4192 family protein n=1 Tax=Nocardia cyriacigeorgica TaxID=135487 RepID=UPI002455790D|nr:DUF4192 family protein [Nocardia cyriacigeorgica]